MKTPVTAVAIVVSKILTLGILGNGEAKRDDSRTDDRIRSFENRPLVQPPHVQEERGSLDWTVGIGSKKGKVQQAHHPLPTLFWWSDSKYLKTGSARR